MNKIQKFAVAVVSAALVMGLGTGATAKTKPPVRGALVHPCDVQAGTRDEKKTEALCLKVWAQDHQIYKSGETPAGPTLVTEIRNQIEWSVQNEGISRKTAEVEFGRALAYERKAYLGRKH